METGRSNCLFGTDGKYHVEKALLVPINEGATYYQDCSQTNQWLGSMVDHSDGKFIAFADVLPMGGYFYDTAPYSLEQAVTEYGLKGLKLHPSNLGIPVDSLEVEPQDIYETYCDILNQMDFTDEEIERIAFRNISGILGLPE